MKWKISISENALKYVGGIAIMLILVVIGLALTFGSLTQITTNTAIGIGLLLLACFVGFLLIRSSKRK